ncbi:hypothetical protein FRB95_012145 [Tulasnella sp. JGI-2019a]|nr:hypothetical protein FRB95_012145 [Tulasnella sp. JGI-2019a]
MRSPIADLTADGYDMQFGVNTLGHAHFTLLLLPQLLAGVKSSSDGKARVVNVSSFAAYVAGRVGIYWDTVIDTPSRKKVDTADLYAQSKYGNIVFSNELARRFGDQGIVSTALHPGVITSTGITQYTSDWLKKAMVRILWPPPIAASLTQFIPTHRPGYLYNVSAGAVWRPDIVIRWDGTGGEGLEREVAHPLGTCREDQAVK